MRFAKSLYGNQGPEWSFAYLNYNSARKALRDVSSRSLNQQSEIDLTDLLSFLETESSRIEEFYIGKHDQILKNLDELTRRYGDVLQSPREHGSIDKSYLRTALHEVRSGVLQLSWHTEINRRAFQRIYAKLEDIERGAEACQTKLSGIDAKYSERLRQLLDEIVPIERWIYAPAGFPQDDDSAATHSIELPQGLASHLSSGLSQEVLERMDAAIITGKARLLHEALLEASRRENHQESQFQSLLLSLLERSVSIWASTCVHELLPRLLSIQNTQVKNGRNCLHEAIVTAGRAELERQEAKFLDDFVREQAPPRVLFGLHSKYLNPDKGPLDLQAADNTSSSFIADMLDVFRTAHRPALIETDVFGRLPLHYAALYGFTKTCEELLQRMQKWDQLRIQGAEWSTIEDSDGCTPLHLSLIGGHTLTAKALLRHYGKDAYQQIIDLPGSCLVLAVRLNQVEVVRLLIEGGIDLSYATDLGETALHVATRLNHIECVKALMEGTPSCKADLNARERINGWTPLMVACAEGHTQLLEVLIEAGADPLIADTSGWTAKEHAALRGYMAIVRKLAYEDAAAQQHIQRRPDSLGSLSALKVDASSLLGQPLPRTESVIIISMGSPDTKSDIQPVELDSKALKAGTETGSRHELFVRISVKGASKETSVINLPVMEDFKTKPFVFTSRTPSKVQMLFDLVRKNARPEGQMLGRAVASLEHIKPKVGSSRYGIQGHISVPFLAVDTLDTIGTANFNLTLVMPFTHPNLASNRSLDYWKDPIVPTIVGHRGLGKNVTPGQHLQIGENTIQSFITASDLGASFVEFDVQLTKDLVPIIYHDFFVSETGIDAPTHGITLDQFLHISKSQQPRRLRNASANRRNSGVQHEGDFVAGRPRSLSEGTFDDNVAADMIDRMKKTVAYNYRGFKGNVRGDFIQEPLTTLQEMLKSLPESLGFNIEIKYPMLFECELWGMDSYGIELNTYVDTVLTKVFDLGTGRNIMFSSFNPDICVLLSLKQRSIPVFFLTDAGGYPAGDIRATSLQEAIRFAKRWGLHGIVSAAEPLVLCPKLIHAVKDAGLLCASYGTPNNDPRLAKLQADAGIDALIVDSVRAISESLRQ